MPKFGQDVKPVEVKVQAVERTRLNLPDPTPLKARNIEWIVVTPENIDDVWKKLKEKNVDLVLFALTDDGYEQLSLNMAEIRTLLANQRNVVIKYREYYEPVEKPISK